MSAADMPFEHSLFLVSKQELARARGIDVVRIKREQHNQDLCFSSRPFVLCGLPVRRLSKNRRTSSFTRGGMGSSSFRSGHPEVGVPFGQDRPVPIFLATVAVQQKTQDQVRHSCGDVGELWNSSGRRGVPVAYGCLRTDLRRDHILRR